MYSFSRFSLTSMTTCGRQLRSLGYGATSLEEVGDRLVDHLYQSFRDPETHESELALVRCFKIHPYGGLPQELQILAQQAFQQPVAADVKCLTLLATAGDQPRWNQTSASENHRVIPLASEESVRRVPMVTQLIQQLGLSINTVLAPTPDMLMDLHERTYNVFHIPDAVGSPAVPHQTDFVIPYGIRSVLGFGGMLPSGNLISLILFSKVPIQRETAQLFKPLALNVKFAVLPYEVSPVLS